MAKILIMRRMLLALLLAGLSVLPGNPAGASTSIVLSASSGPQGVAMFTLRSPLTLTGQWSFTGTGSYRVAAILQAYPVDAGARYPTVIWDNAVTDRGGLGASFPLRLPAGAYYLYLSSDKPVSVILPSSTSGAQRQLRTRPANLQSILTQGAGSQSTPPVSEENHDHAFTQHSSVTFLQAYAHISAAAGAGRDTISACIGPRGDSSCSGGGEFQRTGADEGSHNYIFGGSALSLSADTGFSGAARASARYQTLGLHHVDRWIFLSMSFPV